MKDSEHSFDWRVTIMYSTQSGVSYVRHGVTPKAMLEFITFMEKHSGLTITGFQRIEV